MTVFFDQSNEWIERVAAIQSTIALPDGSAYVTTVQTAEPYLPSDMSSAKCPFFINEIMGGETKFLATGGLQWVSTRLSMVLCVMRREENTNLAFGVHDTLLWRTAVFTTFAAHLQLGDTIQFPRLPYILEAPIIDWTPPDLYEYGTAQYLALKFTLAVKEVFSLVIHT